MIMDMAFEDIVQDVAVESTPDTLEQLEAKLPDIPHARYAVEENGKWMFYLVDKPAKTSRWAGWTFLKVQAGDENWRIKTPLRRAAVYRLILADVNKAFTNYGLQIGKCGICGKALTVPESIQRGIGPVCLSKVGAWL